MKEYKKYFVLLGSKKKQSLKISLLLKLADVLHEGCSVLVTEDSVLEMANILLSHVDPSTGELTTQKRNVPEDELFRSSSRSDEGDNDEVLVEGAIVLEDEDYSSSSSDRSIGV